MRDNMESMELSESDNAATQSYNREHLQLLFSGYTLGLMSELKESKPEIGKLYLGYFANTETRATSSKQYNKWLMFDWLERKFKPHAA